MTEAFLFDVSVYFGSSNYLSLRRRWLVLQFGPNNPNHSGKSGSLETKMRN